MGPPHARVSPRRRLVETANYVVGGRVTRSPMLERRPAWASNGGPAFTSAGQRGLDSHPPRPRRRKHPRSAGRRSSSPRPHRLSRSSTCSTQSPRHGRWATGMVHPLPRSAWGGQSPGVRARHESPATHPQSRRGGEEGDRSPKVTEPRYTTVDPVRAPAPALPC